MGVAKSGPIRTGPETGRLAQPVRVATNTIAIRALIAAPRQVMKAVKN